MHSVNPEIETLSPENAEIETLYSVKSEIETLYPENPEIETLYPVKPEIETLYPEYPEIETLYPVEPEIETLYLVNRHIGGLGGRGYIRGYKSRLITGGIGLQATERQF